VSNYQKEITKLQDDIETINEKLKQVQNQDALSEEATQQY